MRKSSGLRNKFRTGGLSSYSSQRKSRRADNYGEYNNGRCVRPGMVAGRMFDPLAEAKTFKDRAVASLLVLSDVSPSSW